MLAMRREADIAHEHHIVVALDLLEDAIEGVGGIFTVALEQLLVGLDHPLRRIAQAFACRIVAGPAQQDAHGLFGLLARRANGRRIGSSNGIGVPTGGTLRTTIRP